MGGRRPYRIDYTHEAVSHLKAMTAYRAAAVLETVVRQLSHEPGKTTRNRKPLRANPLAPWELRIGDIRVYFDVVDGPEAIVTVRAVGVKRREKVLIGGEEFDLL